MTHYDNKFKKCMLERFLVPGRQSEEILDELYFRVYRWVEEEYPEDDPPSEGDIKNMYENFMSLFIQKKFLVKSALINISIMLRDDYSYFINQLKRYFIPDDYSSQTPCDIDIITFYTNYIDYLKRASNDVLILLLQMLLISYRIRANVERSNELVKHQRHKQTVVSTGAIFNNNLEENESRIAFTDYYRNNKVKSVVWRKLLSCIPSNFIDPEHDHLESVVNPFLDDMVDIMKDDVGDDIANKIIDNYLNFFELVHLQDNMVKFMRLISKEANDYYKFFKVLRKVAFIHNVHHPNTCNFNMNSVFDKILESDKDDLPIEDKKIWLFLTVLYHSWDRKQRLNYDELTEAESGEDQAPSIMPPYRLSTFQELEEDAKKATTSNVMGSTFDDMIEDINKGVLEYTPYPAIEDAAAPTPSKKRKRGSTPHAPGKRAKINVIRRYESINKTKEKISNLIGQVDEYTEKDLIHLYEQLETVEKDASTLKPADYQRTMSFISTKLGRIKAKIGKPDPHVTMFLPSNVSTANEEIRNRKVIELRNKVLQLTNDYDDKDRVVSYNLDEIYRDIEKLQRNILSDTYKIEVQKIQSKLKTAEKELKRYYNV